VRIPFDDFSGNLGTIAFNDYPAGIQMLHINMSAVVMIIVNHTSAGSSVFRDTLPSKDYFIA